MKKLLFFLIILVVGTSIMAQHPSTFGLKTGMTIANQSFLFTPIDIHLPTEVLPGPGALFFIEAFKRDHLSFQLDGGFLSKGSKTTASSVTVNHLQDDQIMINEGPLTVSRFNYFSLAPMARIRKDHEAFSYYALLGMRFDILLKYTSTSPYPLEEQSRFILGLSSGLGMEYQLEKLALFTEVQYFPDLSPVTNEEPLLVNNNCLFVNIGIRRVVGNP